MSLPKTPGRLAALAVLAAGLLPLASPVAHAQQPQELSFGTLAPDNTPWSDILKNFKKSLQGATKGRIKVKLFLNGVLGDEAQMLQKMKFGQITGGGYSTGGISTVVPELQVLELPFLFRDNEETDYILDRVVRADMAAYCERRGLYLYIWAENGWVDIGHKRKPIRSLADLRGEKMHMQESDVKKAFWTAVGASPIPLAVTDVLGALQRGTVDGYDTTPIFGSAAQWTTETRYWTDSNHIYQPAAVLFDLRWWNGLDPADRETILSFAPALEAAARRDVRTVYGPDERPEKGLEKEIFDEFEKQKIEVIALDPLARDELRRATLGVADELIAKGAFPRELYEKIQRALEEFRKRRAGGRVTLSIATPGPDRAPWTRALETFKRDVEEATAERIRVDLHGGDGPDDEADRLRKVLRGELCGAALSTRALSAVVPELSVLELPFLFRDGEEADGILDDGDIRADLAKACERRALHLYVWADDGWLDIAHRERPILSLADIPGATMPAPDDAGTEALFWRAAGARPLALAPADIRDALARGRIDGFGATPFGASGAGWMDGIGYWTDSNHIYRPAAVVFQHKWWNGLREDDRLTILSFAARLQAAARSPMRAAHDGDGRPLGGLEKDLFDRFRARGVEVAGLDPDAREELRLATLGIAGERIAAGAFPRELHERIVKALEALRAAKAGAPGRRP